MQGGRRQRHRDRSIGWRLSRVAVLLVLAGLSSRCGREPDRAGSSDTSQLWKPKEGATYVGDLPKEIIWLKDAAEMVLVPGGEFLFAETKEKRTLPSFYVDKYPVTNGRYQRFIRATGHKPPHADDDWAEPFNWKGESYPDGKASYPAVIVSWFDALAYCEWAGKSLPTEELWEKAARGTDGRAYPWGDEFDEKMCNSYLTGLEAITPVGKFPEGASPYGCHDMAGNVWEWTRTPKIDGYVMKGGSFFEGEMRVRSFGHVWGKPHLKGQNCGFRTCYVIEE